MSDDRMQSNEPEPADFGGSSSGARPARRKASKSATMEARLRAEKGTGWALVRRLEQQHRNDPVMQFTMFWVEIELQALTGRDRDAGDKTIEAYQARSIHSLRILREGGYPFNQISSLRQKHALAVQKAMESRGFEASTIVNCWSVLRRFLNFLGRADHMPAPQNCLENPQRAKRSLANVVDKSFTGNNVVVEVAIADCRRKFHPIPAWRLDFMHEFGARVEEAGHASASTFRKDYVHLHDGTKGGLTRDVPIETEGQRRVVAEFFKLLERFPSRDRRLYEPGKRRTWKSVRNRMNYIARQLGLTKKILGVTQHSLRHEYAQKRLLATGKIPPVRGGELSYSADRDGLQTVTKELGHGRLNIVSAYVGSTAIQQRHEAAVAKKIYDRFQTPEFTTAFLDCGVRRVVVVGAAARQLFVRDRALIAWDGDKVGQESPALLELLRVVFPKGVLFMDIAVEDQEDTRLEVFDRDAALRELR